MSEEEKGKKKAEKAAAAKPAKASGKKAENHEPVDAVAPRLRELYKTQIINKMKTEFKYSNVMQVPRLEKIVVNAGLGKSTQNIKVIEQATKDIISFTGQKPVSCKSKKAISNFKLRAGLPIGVMVTLRGARMYEFLDRLLSLALPRIRDFRGVNEKGFDGRGNFTMGLKEQIVFPEVVVDNIENTFGMNITVVTTATSDEEGRALLTHFGFPFRKKNQPTPQKAA